MSLRGSETTEAISQDVDKPEIATLPPVARNDKKGIATQSLKGRSIIDKFSLFVDDLAVMKRCIENKPKMVRLESGPYK